MPKGEYTEEEDAWAAARREFKEETGHELPKGERLDLGNVTYNNKIVTVWAVQGDLDTEKVVGNTFTLEWPPKSGKKQEFPEVDMAGWFMPGSAKQKLVKGQVELVSRLCDRLGISMDDEAGQQVRLL